MSPASVKYMFVYLFVCLLGVLFWPQQ